eukprot:gene10419-11335_t
MMRLQSSYSTHLGKNDEDRTFEDLNELDLTRKELNKEVRIFHQTSMLRIFMGTILPHLLTSRQTWLINCQYIIIRVLLRYEIINLGPDLPGISTTILSIIGGFLSFFLVFFVSQAYTRFMTQYDISMRIKGRIVNLSLFARKVLPPAEALRLTRYANATHVLGYVGLSDAYTSKNLFEPLNNKYHLLTESEVERLNVIGLKSGSSCTVEVIVWMFEMIYSHFDESNAVTSKRQQTGEEAAEGEGNDKARPMDMITLQMMTNEVLLVRGGFADLFHCSDQSIPFSYMHLLVVVTGAYLILMTYAIATYFAVSDSVFPDLLGAFIVALNSVFVIGLRVIGRHMIDPYGGDVQDLAVPSFLEATIKISRQIMSGNKPAPASLMRERYLDSLRPPLAKGFGQRTSKDSGVTSSSSSTFDIEAGTPSHPAKETILQPPSSSASKSPAMKAKKGESVRISL